MYKEAVSTWFHFYHCKTGQEYYFSGIDGRHLKQLLKKIESKVKEKSMEHTEENILNSFKGFLNTINDRWILEHLELKNVNSNFNSLYAQAFRNNPFTKAEQYIDFAKRKFSSGS